MMKAVRTKEDVVGIKHRDKPAEARESGFRVVAKCRRRLEKWQRQGCWPGRCSARQSIAWWW